MAVLGDSVTIRRVTSLVDFLAEATDAAERDPVRDILSNGSGVPSPVIWLDELPDGVRAASNPSDDVLLRVRPQALQPEPLPPAELHEWIDSAEPRGHDAAEPTFLDTEENPPVSVVQLFTRWVSSWRKWAASHPRLLERRRLYEQLEHVAKTLEQQDDEYEFVLAVGLVSWTSPDGTIRRHLVSELVQPKLDRANAEVTVSLVSGKRRVEDKELFAGLDEYQPDRARASRQAILEGEAVLLADGTMRLVEEWLSTGLTEAVDLVTARSTPTTRPVLSASPALLLRPRSRALLAETYKRIAAALREPDAQVPVALAQLIVDTEADQRHHWLATQGAVAGDIRANENPGLLAVQTLFAREHNRIVDKLPKSLPEEVKFQIARRVVIATEQYITYEQFLPSLGVQLRPYRGYDPNVNPTLGNEFATIGYRGHSMLHDDIRLETEAGQYTSAELDAIRAKGVTVTKVGRSVEFTIPPDVSLFNPNLVDDIHLGSVLRGLGQYAQANNDEQIGDIVRTIPVHAACPPVCQTAIFDISAIDVERGRDHGLGSYNQLRQAFGLTPKSSFADVTGESSESFPADPLLTPGDEINDPNSLDFLRLRDANGRTLPAGTDKAVTGDRRTPLAARLKALYGSVSTLDGFVGMVAEPKVPGTEFGELQLAMWRKQFEALRDGDRFFYRNDPVLAEIRRNYGIDYRRSLSDLIAQNTDVPRGDLPANVFRCACP
ncbi:peroxidase family protein [Kibdelosporangium lantanae]|uniref:Peroxidase family protein n=1 Tax=Kibdelosporangium lantanae TaxID=1497396 RepID=A0ABW3M2U3_9PSEU